MLARTISGRSRSSSQAATPLTVPPVPTGMNAGVFTTPCGVVSRPRRARLVDQAQTLTQRLAQDVRLAVPNSIRVGCGGSCVAATCCWWSAP